MSEHTIIAAGQFTVTFTHPLVNDGTPTTISGFKLEGQMVQAQQAMDSSKIVALANGNTITITNNNGSGSLTFAVVRGGGDGVCVRFPRAHPRRTGKRRRASQARHARAGRL